MVHCIQRVGKRFLALAICKRCGKEIKFIKTKKGKWLPVEQEMVVITPVEKIGRPYITEDGQMVYGLPTAPDCCYTGISDMKAYLCHFANCLQREKQNKKFQ